MVTKHEDNVCKQCNEKVSSFMELLKHVAKYHTTESVEEIEFKEADKNNINVEVVIQEDKDKRLESMVDKVSA